MKPHHICFHLSALCLTAAIGAIASAGIASSAAKPVSPAALPLLVRNQVLFDWKNLLVGRYKDVEERLKMPGAAAQIWNWDHTWYSTKAYDREIRSAFARGAGLQIIGNVLYP